MNYVGFTGRASDLSKEQLESLTKLVLGLDSRQWVALHNDGEGGDQVFAAIAGKAGLAVEVTPDHLTPMPRNRHLVSVSDLLIAVPPTDFLLKKGSGTWETIKYMWKAGKPVRIILSTGQVVSTKNELPVGGVGIEPT